MKYGKSVVTLTPLKTLKSLPISLYTGNKILKKIWNIFSSIAKLVISWNIEINIAKNDKITTFNGTINLFKVHTLNSTAAQNTLNIINDFLKQ